MCASGLSAKQLAEKSQSRTLLGPGRHPSNRPLPKSRLRRLTNVDAVAISLFAKGLATGEISAYFTGVHPACGVGVHERSSSTPSL